MAGEAVAMVETRPIPTAREESAVPVAIEATGTRPPIDEKTFRAFYERTAPILRGYLARVLGNRTLADDLLQEAFLRLLRSGFVGINDDHTKNYLFRIATNLMRDHFRQSHRETVELPESASIPEKTGDIDLKKDFQGAFCTLNARERALLWLAYVEGSSHHEIAHALDLKATSIRVMLFRARQHLAEAVRAKGMVTARNREGVS